MRFEKSLSEQASVGEGYQEYLEDSEEKIKHQDEMRKKRWEERIDKKRKKAKGEIEIPRDKYNHIYTTLKSSGDFLNISSFSGRDQEMALQVAEDIFKEKYDFIYEKLKYERDPWKIREFSGEERKIALKVYRDIVAKRYEGSGEIRKSLLQYLNENPDVGNDEILESVRVVAENHNISFEILKKELLPILNKYQIRRDEIRRHGDRELREHLDESGYHFQEDVGNVIRKVFCVEIRGGLSEKRYNYETFETEEVPLKEGGAFSSGTIYTENFKGDSSGESIRTSRHEEQHAIHDLVEETENLSEDLNMALASAKNEILARVRVLDFDFLEFYLTNDEGGYERKFKNLSEEDREIYNVEVKKAIGIAKELLKIYSMEEAVGILESKNVTLDKWEKIYNRLENKDKGFIQDKK
jgi:hypothetical protein